MKYKHILFLISFLIFCIGSIQAQTDIAKKAGIKKNSDCLNLTIHLFGCDICGNRDTLTLSEFNEAIGINVLDKACRESESFKIISYDMEVVGKRNVHVVGSIFKKFEITILDRPGTINFTNCVVNVSSGSKENIPVLANPKTFYIVK